MKELGVSADKATFSEEEQAEVANIMNNLKSQGYSDDEIAAELEADGFGAYKSWLKSY